MTFTGNTMIASLEDFDFSQISWHVDARTSLQPFAVEIKDYTVMQGDLGALFAVPWCHNFACPPREPMLCLLSATKWRLHRQGVCRYKAYAGPND